MWLRREIKRDAAAPPPWAYRKECWQQNGRPAAAHAQAGALLLIPKIRACLAAAPPYPALPDSWGRTGAAAGRSTPQHGVPNPRPRRCAAPAAAQAGATVSMPSGRYMFIIAPGSCHCNVRWLCPVACMPGHPRTNSARERLSHIPPQGASARRPSWHWRVAALAHRTAREDFAQKTHLAGDVDGPRAEVDVGKGSQTEALICDHDVSTSSK